MLNVLTKLPLLSLTARLAPDLFDKQKSQFLEISAGKQSGHHSYDTGGDNTAGRDPDASETRHE